MVNALKTAKTIKTAMQDAWDMNREIALKAAIRELKALKKELNDNWTERPYPEGMKVVGLGNVIAALTLTIDNQVGTGKTCLLNMGVKPDDIP